MLEPTLYTLRMLFYLSHLKNSSFVANSTVDSHSLPTAAGDVQLENSVCYDDYGCYDTAYPWSTPTRPIYLLPQHPDIIKVRFYLYTRNNPKSYQVLVRDRVNITESYFNSKLKTYFIVHGFMDNVDIRWPKAMIDAFLVKDDVNVIFVDWGSGSIPPYMQATANTRLVATALANFIMFLADNIGIKPTELHVIGHSLGSHIAGYAGTRLKEMKYKLGRITALDPAEPYFENTELIVRIDHTDAEFVDVIHTDSGPYIDIINRPMRGFGILEPIGHIDFYPNGGREMPGCERDHDLIRRSIHNASGSLIEGLKEYLTCNHLRAVDYFIDSLNCDGLYLGVECTSWEHFLKGNCQSCHVDGTCARMGIHSDLWGKQMASKRYRPRKMFLKTGSYMPFCGYQYRVHVQISSGARSVANGGESGSFFITIEGKSRNNVFSIEEQELSIDSKQGGLFEPGQRYSFVLFSADYLGILNKIIITWRSESSMLNPLSWHSLLKPSQIFVQAIVVESIEAQQRYNFCTLGEPLIHDEPKALVFQDSDCPPNSSEEDSKEDEENRKKSYRKFIHYFGINANKNSETTE